MTTDILHWVGTKKHLKTQTWKGHLVDYAGYDHIQTKDTYCRVFSVTPTKIDRIKSQKRYIQQIKSRILEMKGGKYAKIFAKIQVRAIFHMRDIRRNVLPKFIELCMETSCWCPYGLAPTWRPESNRNICHWVLLRKRAFNSRGTHKHYSNTFSNTWTVQIAQ